MHGYGGFGYDTSHVPAPENHSELYKLAESGDISRVMDLVGKVEDPDERAKIINHARRWTEVEYRYSGFTNEYEWFDLTPVSIAARNGHTDVLMYLLEQDADPTLKGCYDENACATTEQAAKLYLDQMMLQVMNLRTQTYSPPVSITFQGQTAEDKAKEVYLAFKRAKYNLSLVQEALKFWEKAPYAQTGNTRDGRKTFSNRPRKGLAEALRALETPVLGDDPKDENEINLITRTFLRHKRRNSEDPTSIGRDGIRGIAMDSFTKSLTQNSKERAMAILHATNCFGHSKNPHG